MITTQDTVLLDVNDNVDCVLCCDKAFVFLSSTTIENVPLKILIFLAFLAT